MSLLTYILLCYIYCESASSAGPEHRYQVSENAVDEDEIEWMLLPGSRGDVQVAILKGLEPEAEPLDSVEFFLYTRDNPATPERKLWNTSCLPIFTKFSPERRSKVLIHGFGDAENGSIMYPLLREAYLSRGDVNVFEVDWSKLAATPWYLAAARNTDRVGMRVAALIDHLVRSAGARTDRFHLVGFSLGAHVAGAAGRSLKTGVLERITGLDPAQVLFTQTPIEYRLDPSDAALVEVVHTSGGYLGFGVPIGHRDFFPNGGHWPQPGCPLDYVAICSHRRAYYYYAEDIAKGNGFTATQCESYPTFATGMCARNKANSLEMVNTNGDAHLNGKFFLDTNSDEPYGIRAV